MVYHQYLFLVPLMAAAGAAVYLLSDHLFLSGPFMAAIVAGIQVLVRVVFHLGFPAALGTVNIFKIFYTNGILLFASLCRNYTIYTGNME